LKKKNGDGGSEDEDGGQYGTTVLDNQTNGKKKAKEEEEEAEDAYENTTVSSQKKKSDNESDPEEDTEQFGTMVVNKAQPPTKPLPQLSSDRKSLPPQKPLPASPVNKKSKAKEMIDVKSVFEGSNALRTELVIPSNMNKSDLIASYSELKRQYQRDKQLLDEYYNKQVGLVEQKIEE